VDIASLFLPTRAAKAESGVGAVMMSHSPAVSLFQRSPQAMMKDAQAVATSDVTIRAAERVIANRVSTTPWKLEDAEDVTVGDGPDDNSDPAYLAVQSLLEKPYRPIPGDPQSTTPRTWSQLSAITARHIGICGSAFWYLDQTDALAGTPLSILYINPARMTPDFDDNGALCDWIIDGDSRSGGSRLGLRNVLHFTLEPADVGVFPAGLVETALAKVEIGKLSDRHVSMMLAAGGRLSGIMAPKEGYLDDAVYRQLVRDIRTISEAPDAAKRMLILRGPVEYKEAAVSPSDLDLVALNTLTRDDKLSLWGVPHSILGIPTPGGLGGGASKDSDVAIFWQNAVSPRLRTMAETIQFELLDRFAELGVVVEIEFEEPEFDDEMPAFDMASKAANLPLTNRERRDLIGLDPFGDTRDDEVWLPAGLMPAYDVTGAPRPMSQETYATNYADPFESEQSLYAKAGPVGQRRDAIAEMTDALKRAIRQVARDTAEKIDKHYSHIVARPNDLSVWWNEAQVQATILEAMRPSIRTIAAETLAAPAKADALDVILPRLMDRVGVRIVTVPSTLFGVIRKTVEEGIRDGLSARDLGKLVETRLREDEYIAERIARTEVMRVQNWTRVEGLREAGITQVRMVDGDDDEVCKERDGQIVDLETALAEVDAEHPNGTLRLEPITSFAALGDAARAERLANQAGGMKATVGSITMPEIRLEPIINITMPEQPAPVVNVAPADVHVAAPVVNVAAAEAPVVNVTTPDVTVNLPEQKATLPQDIRIISMPERTVSQVVVRDPQGRVAGLETVTD
jgi:hypothetical protein